MENNKELKNTIINENQLSDEAVEKVAGGGRKSISGRWNHNWPGDQTSNSTEGGAEGQAGAPGEW